MPRLLVIKGPDQGKQFDLTEQTVTVGRDASNRIRLHDTEVSRRHAEFQYAEGAHTLHDLQSANGTFVNNQRVQRVTLKAGDQIVIGQSLLVFGPNRQEKHDTSGDLAQKINMIARPEMELASAIVKSINEDQASQILSRPDQTSPWLQGALANLAIMYEASQAVSHILDLDHLLNKILELVFRAVAAERGCIMLVNQDGGALEPKAIRWRDENHEESLQLSRTITDHVLEHREGVLITDAAHDQRFASGQSILKYGIREVICVPMKGRHENLGVLYLDTHSTAKDTLVRNTGTGKFTEDHLALAIAVAHQAALAVEETRYHQALVQAERLAAIGQTIAALSHHIKNILQGLRSGSEILKMGLKDKNDNLIQQGWRIAEKNQGKIYDLVMDMLSYSKEREPSAEPTDVNDLVREVVDLLAARAKELGVKLEVSLAENLPIVPSDPDGINRALLNIVGNAIDAVEGRPSPQVTVGTRLAEDGVRIVVLDNGTGIPPAKVQEIFKPFVSTKGARGTGLGLPVSRKILREHGGDIIVQSQDGVGSKFILKLPFKSPLQDLGLSNPEIPIMPPEPN